MQKVQIIDTYTGRVTREENAAGLTEGQQACLVRNLKSAARGAYALSPGDEQDRYQVRVIVKEA